MIEIWLDGRGIGKARPRSTRSGLIYTESRYGEWKKSAVLQIKTLKLPMFTIPVKVICYFVNFFSSDSDNLTGSVLDILVQSGVLRNDSSSFVTSSSGSFVKCRKQRGQDKLVGILIQISQAEIQYLDDSIASRIYS